MSKSIKVLVVDDEPIARDILETYLKQADGFELAGQCRNAVEAFKALSLNDIDLVLLDINMPEISGVELIRSLKSPPLVIFTTAYPEYAVESYELDIVDYLLKPISLDRFQRAMGKAARRLRPPVQEPASPVAAAPVATEAERLMFVRSEGKWIRIDIAQLWFVEGLKDYVKLYNREGRLVVRSTMKNFEEQLAAYPNFIRVHKSFIVNLDFVSETDGNFLKLKDQLISIGNTYKDEVNKLLSAYKMH